MSKAVRLLWGVHAHQPVGNFDHVIDDALARCYRPFLETLERHPRIVVSLHVSGWLLGYLNAKFPDDVARIARMVRAGQLEMIGGGDTEPVLAAIPDRDRRAQLRALTLRLRDLFVVRPRGAWLTERVWESSVVPALHDSGLRFVAVDDSHLRSAGIAGSLDGYYSTEESGKRLDIFPISENLRYMIPFAPAADVVEAIERTPSGTAAIYFDDIEKFGIWPDTYEWVYERGWLEKLFTRIEASRRIQTQTFGSFHRRNASRGLVYLPATSYPEMNEWLHGGTWMDFLLRYPEANWMHKRMQAASRRFHALPRARQTASMREALHRSQANDGYWHGLFGGVYLPFLRASVFKNLASLDEQLDAFAPRPASEQSDVDLDGREEIALRAGRFFAAIRPSEGGRLCELTDYPLQHNFADVLARREEDYYEVIRSGGSAHPERRHMPGIASIHDRVAFKVAIDPEDLVPDAAPRGLFVDSWRGAVIEYGGAPVDDEAAALCRAKLDGAAIEKSVRIEAGTLTVRYLIAAQRAITGVLSVQLDFALPSAAGPNGSFVVWSGRIHSTAQDEAERVPGLSSILQRADVRVLILDDPALGGRIDLTMQPPSAAATAPLVTVSRSESGFEKITQAATVTLSWEVSLAAGERAERTISLGCATTRSSDRPHADAPAVRGTGTS